MKNRADIKKCDVFISWTGTDIELKKAIGEHLKKNGIFPLLSDEECQGDFEEWSRSAATSAHIFMPIITKNALKSEGMKWELEEIDKKLGSDEKDFWRGAILPVCQDLDTYNEYVSKFSIASSAIMSKISAIPLKMENSLPTEECLNEIFRKTADRISDNFFELYNSNAQKTYIKLIPLYSSEKTFGDTNYHFNDLYIRRSITEIDDKNEISTFDSPHELLNTRQISFVFGSAGCGKTQYINQIRQSSGDGRIVITLSCADISKSKNDLFDDMFEEFHKICGKRTFYTKESFSRLLDVKDLVLVLDGLDEITTRSATREFIQKVNGYYSYNAESTSIIFTGRNENDKEIITLDDTKVRIFRLDRLSEQNICDLGNNLFYLFGNDDMGKEFYAKVKELNTEIKSNPLLLSQLAIVYNDSQKIPETVVGILDAVSEITFRTDREMHRNLTAIPTEYQPMINNDISGILKRFSREKYITSSKGKDVSVSGIFNRILKNKYLEEKSSCRQRTEFLMEYLSNRAILVGENFYHKMFLEYFTAVSYYEDCFDDDYGELENADALAELFGQYENPYWSDVIKLFLIKSDRLTDPKETDRLYREILSVIPATDYSLLFDVCRDLIRNKEAAEVTLLTHILERSANGALPPYGPIFWYIPEYNLYEEALWAAEKLSGNAKALALVRDVCFIFGKYSAKAVTDRIDFLALFEKSKESLSGIRLALCQLFYTGECDHTDCESLVYPRCFSISEARSFMKYGHGVFERINTPFEDELGLFAHEMYPVLNGEYIGFVSCPYDKIKVSDKLSQMHCNKLSILALANTEDTKLDYIAFTRSSVRVFYTPENIITFDDGCIAHMPLYMFFCPINDLLMYAPYNIKVITIPDGFTQLDGGFCIFNELEEVLLPEGLNRLCEHVFGGCQALSRLKLPISLKHIESYALSWCAKLEEIILPEGLETIGNDGLSGCGLKEIILPDSLKSIGNYAFHYCGSLSRVVIPQSITKISLGMFWGCKDLKQVELPDSITEIEDWSFINCQSLTEITLPKALVSLGCHAFGECSSLKHIVFNESLTSIGDFAFANCTKLTEIRLPASLSQIGAAPFLSCDKITTIEMSPDADFFPFDIIYNCHSLMYLKLPKRFYNKAKSAAPRASIKFNDNDATYYSFNDFDIYNGKAYITPGATTIPAHEFEGSSTITANIPDSVKEIGDNAFNHCDKLYNVSLPHGLEKIGNRAFEYCTVISTLTIPDGLKYIGNAAFKNCYSLRDIVIPQSVEYMGEEAFSGCSGIKSISLPDTLTEINRFTFQWCSKIKNLKFPTSLKKLGRGAFYGCRNLSEHIVLPDGLTDIDADAFQSCGKLPSIYIPDSVTFIGNGAFGECKALTHITIPKNITTINDNTFKDCTNLKKVSLPDGLKKIGWRAFENCSLLTEINLPDELTIIEDDAFINCSALSEILLPSTLETIGAKAFKNCTSLSYINIHEGIDEINDEAFENCQKLKRLVLPKTLERIGANAFIGCTGLESVTISSNFKKDISSIFGDIDPDIIEWID